MGLLVVRIYMFLILGLSMRRNFLIKSVRWENCFVCVIKRVAFMMGAVVIVLSSNLWAQGHGGQDDLYGASKYTLFESGQVKPMAYVASQRLLLAVNTPDSKVEVFKVKRTGKLRLVKSIPVGLEPISIKVRNNREAWVVNHLSDSVSVIDLRPYVLDVIATLQVGDEPSDVVFAGRGNRRAFVTAAHRGQNTNFSDSLTEPSVGRADVWVFDATKIRREASSSLISIVNLFTNTPRALTVSPDGKYVYAAGFKTGNQTSVIPHSVVHEHGGNPAPLTDYVGVPQPATSLIVKFDGETWRDDVGRDWSEHVKLSLPDKDVFVIDASADTPQLIAGDGGFYSGVGTVLFSMATNPVNGNVYVSNIESFNHKRFSGPGNFAGHSLRGKFVENRITVLTPSGDVIPLSLNPHIDFDVCCEDIPNAESIRSLALPGDLVVSKDGKTLYVAGYGSNKIGVYDTEKLESGTVDSSLENQIMLSGGGPAGMLLDEKRHLLFVMTRFDNSIVTIDLKSKQTLHTYPLYNPESEVVVEGRKFMYDASTTSGHGESACASCHIFGDMDGLAWDLGNPDSTTEINPGPVILDFRLGENGTADFRALKGPMVTQSLRGLANHGPMHWRGDRTAGNFEPTAQPDSGNFNEVAAFKQFDEAFVDVMGLNSPPDESAMQLFAEFALELKYPPNPIRNLDNTLTEDQNTGREFFFGPKSDAFFNCEGCHTLNPDGNKEFGVAHPGFYGTDGRYSNDVVVPQVVKIPHLRNLYQKIGMFGIAPAEGVLTDLPNGENLFMGDQISGFGYGHDGTFDTVFRFIRDTVFSFRVSQFPGDPGNEGGFTNDEAGDVLRRQVESYVLAFESNIKPVVGQQETIGSVVSDEASERIALFMSQAEQGACDLIAKSARHGFLYIGDDMFMTDNKYYPYVNYEVLQKFNRYGYPLTYTCVPFGSGLRMGVDRNLNGVLDAQERYTKY